MKDYILPHAEKHARFHACAFVLQDWARRDFPPKVPWWQRLSCRRIVEPSKLTLRLSMRGEMIIPKQEVHYTAQDSLAIAPLKGFEKAALLGRASVLYCCVLMNVKLTNWRLSTLRRALHAC